MVLLMQKCQPWNKLSENNIEYLNRKISSNGSVCYIDLA